MARYGRHSLQRSMGHFIKAQASTIIRLYAFYEPLRTFTYIALPFILAGLGVCGTLLLRLPQRHRQPIYPIRHHWYGSSAGWLTHLPLWRSS